MKPRRTVVGIDGDAFVINGQPTYAGRTYRGMRVEGLLMNARMVQGIFDDLNPETRSMWQYPDGPWDPERNTEEFVAAMPSWYNAGLLGFTINLQGGNPRGYSRGQPWHNSAFDSEGLLRPAYMERLASILDRADELGMVPILGLFYFGQDQRLADEEAVVRGTENATDWLLEQGYTNVLLEICRPGRCAGRAAPGEREHPWRDAATRRAARRCRLCAGARQRGAKSGTDPQHGAALSGAGRLPWPTDPVQRG
jgi:hypothetical protein